MKKNLLSKGETNYTFYLRVKSNIGTFHIPITSDDNNEFVFNWIVFERPVSVYSIQVMVEIIENFEERPKEPLDVITKPAAPEDDISDTDWGCLPPYEIGCFIIDKSQLYKKYRKVA